MATALSMLERAKRGEPDAIAALMNKTLSKKGARVHIKRNGDTYKLLVEGEQAPNQKETVAWIVQGLKKLAIAQMRTAIFYGKAKQSAQPAWQCRVQLINEPTADPFAPETSDDSSEAEPNTTKSASRSQEPAIDLSEHCFTRNQSLLRGKLTLPSKDVCKVVLSFSELANEQKLAVLPHCTKLLRKPEPVEDEALSAETTQWIEQVVALESNDVRKLSIWLSRYCLNPDETAEQLQHRVSPPAAEAEPASAQPQAATQAAEPAPQQTMYGDAGSPSLAGSASSAFAGGSSAPRSGSSQKESFSSDSKIPPWIFPAVCGAVVFISIILGIQSVDSTAYAFPVCEESTASNESCILAVQLVDSDLDFAIAKSKAQPITPEMEAEALEYCTETAAYDFDPYYTSEAYAEQWESGKFEEATLEVTASKTEVVFPGMLLTEVSQTSSAAEGNTNRVACLTYARMYTNADAINDNVQSGDVGLEYLAADIIPTNWPAEPYMEMSEFEVSTAKALGIYDVFISFGSNTLFTAVGIFVAVLFCSCYRCNSYAGIYQMASALAVVEVILSVVPVFGIYGRVAMNVICVGLASMVVKDFHIDWTDGYRPLAMGAGIITGVRTILSLLLYGAIASFV